MPAAVLVGYATRYGSTQEVAETIAAAMREGGVSVDLQPLEEVKTLTGYDLIVIGAPLFMFHWHKQAHRFLSRHRKALLERSVAVFALGPTHEPHDEQEWQDSQSQLDKELAKYPWFHPADLVMFGGKYDPTKLKFPLNKLAGDVPASDIRDWEVIRSWARGLVEQLPTQ